MDTKKPRKPGKLIPLPLTPGAKIGRGRAPELERRISERVYHLLEKHGINRKQFAEKNKIDKSNFYGMLEGKKGWTFRNLMKVARGFGIDVSELFEEIPTVPLVTALTHEGFEHNLIGKEEIGSVPYVPDKENRVLADIYALEIGEDEFELPFKKGRKIYLQKNVETSEFATGDYVVYCQGNGQGVLRQISFSDNDQVIMRALSRDEKDIVVPRDHLKLCDMVISIGLK